MQKEFIFHFPAVCMNNMRQLLCVGIINTNKVANIIYFHFTKNKIAGMEYIILTFFLKNTLCNSF